MIDQPPHSDKRSQFAAIARDNEVALMRTARRLCANKRDQAEDLVQDTLISAYRAFLDGRFDGRHPTAWLLKILTNAYLYARRQDRLESGLDSEAIDDAQENSWSARTAGPDEALLAGTLSESLERALLSLPEANRLCVLLADVEQLPYAEVAAAMNVPIGTVRSRLARARMQMLSFLKDLDVKL